MKKLNWIAGLLGLFVTLPLWFYLLYRVLTEINATELTWFVFWIYIPASIVIHTIVAITQEYKKIARDEMADEAYWYADRMLKRRNDADI